MSDQEVTAGAEARFLVVADMPMLAVALGNAPADDALFTTLAMAGLAELSGFYGVTLPQGARVGVTVQAELVRIEAEDSTGLLQVPREAVGTQWLDAARRLRGTMFVVGRRLELDPDASDQATCDELHTAGLDGRIRGAIIGVAEPRTGLPLFLF